MVVVSAELTIILGVLWALILSVTLLSYTVQCLPYSMLWDVMEKKTFHHP